MDCICILHAAPKQWHPTGSVIKAPNSAFSDFMSIIYFFFVASDAVIKCTHMTLVAPEWFTELRLYRS